MEIPMSFEPYRRIPRHPDWKWEYWDGTAQLSYRPHPICLRREVRLPVPARQRHTVRLADPLGDGERLRSFLTEFWRAEDPYRTVDDDPASEWLRDGLDSSFIRLATPAGAFAEEDGKIIGVVLLELPYRDADVPVPHLSWLSVRSGHRCDGVGTGLLATVVEALHRSGVEQLHSSVSPGNRASLSWHWRTGFQAVSDPLAALGPHARRR
ncbi:MAG: GNAT family N-acetyltransferase [Pseudonocardia sp.]